MSKILGIQNGSHDTSVVYIEDGEIKGIYEEEKLTGVKSAFQTYIDPNNCLKMIKRHHDLEISDFDYITFVNGYQRKFLMEILDQTKRERVFCYSHHKCHAIGAYFTSGFEGKVVSLSHDGKGYHSRGKIFLCENGKYEQIHSQKISLTASLAGVWAASTVNLGWLMLKDEGKVVGLAAHGTVDSKIYNLMAQCLYYKDFDFLPSEWENLYHHVFTHYHKDEFKNETFRVNYAATLQKFTEDIMFEYLSDIHNKYPEYRRLCLSGGLFANVKLNKFINELDFFDEVFIHPAMSDSGLALGSGICKAVELGEIALPKKMKNCFLGQQFSREEWIKILNQNQDELNIYKFSYENVAQLINNGNIIGLFSGRTEYGPRALGARSILVRPTDKETHAKLNSRLNRTEIMPFAPSILEDHLNQVFDAEKSKYASEFMTLCYDTKPNWVKKIPAVIHDKDGSARPQSVSKKNNKFFYDIINAYYNISGIPLVLNTSFNSHGQPINNYPEQVLEHLFKKRIDYLVTDNYIISKKRK
jgi:carbamoyltransferase